MLIKIVVIALYVLMIVVVGIMGMRKTKSFSDFFLGGGQVGPWMTAFTYGTAYFSAVLFIGFAGKIGWGFGYSGIWIAIGNALIGVFGVWFFLGNKIKNMSTEYNVQTIGEFFEKRYDSPFLKLFSSLSIFIFFIPYTAAVFMGLSYLFRSNFNLPYSVALISMGLFTTTYIVMGGYKSMAMIDVIFGIIMILGVTVLLWFTIDKGGGVTAISRELGAINPQLTAAVGPPGWWKLFSLIFLTSVAPFGMPQLLQKFYAVKDKSAVRIGMFASSAFAILICGSAYFIGATTRLFLSPENTPNAFDNGKPIFDALMPELLAKVVPDYLSVIILLLILSASMSTLAALVLISSSSVVKDIYAGFINKKVKDKQLTMLMRIASAFFILLSVILAYMKPATIVAVLSISWGAIGSVFLGPFIWGLFNKKINKIGAIISSVSGLTVCLGLYIAGYSPPEAGTIGMMVSLAIPPLSLLYPSHSEKKELSG